MKQYKYFYYLLFSFFIISLLINSSYQWCLKASGSDSDDIHSIDFSPDGTMFVTGSKSKMMIVWSMLTFQPLFSFNATKQVSSAKFAKDQSFIVMGMIADSTIRVFMAKSPWTQLGNFNAAHTNTREVDVNQASDKILTCGDDKKSNIWKVNPPSYSTFPNLKSNSVADKILSCRFSRGGNAYAVGSQKRVYTYNGGGTLSSSHSNDLDNFKGVDWSPDDSKVVGACKNAKGYWMNSGSINTDYLANYDDMYATTYARDGHYIFFGGKDDKGYLFNQTFSTKINGNANNPAPTLTDSGSDIISSAMSYDSNYLMTGNTDGNFYLYAKVCTGCAAGLYPGLQNCDYCAKVIKGCALCYNHTKCLQCFNGYYYDSANTACLTCDSAKNGCVMCTNSSTCLACAPGYYVNGGSCTKCLLINSGCVLCDSSSNCLACDSKFYLSGGSCSSCQSISNCIRCNASNYCIQCQIGFYQNSGSCSSCPTNCRFCHSTTTCKQCMSGFYQSGGSCVRCSSGCASCNSSACLDCVAGTYLNAGSCNKCPFPCSSCNDTAYCFSCVTGYWGSAGSCTQCTSPCMSCDSATNCLSCGVGYYLVSGTPNTCNLCTIANCHTCNSTACFYCQPQYYQNLGSCSKCSLNINYCMICSNTTVCQFCLQGYYHSGGTGNLSCVACPAGCSKCSSNLVCSSCLPRYYFNSGSCTQCPSSNFCDTCSSSSVCQSCITGYFKDGNICRKCSVNITYCLQCLNQTYCLSCETGYYISSPSSCTKCAANCVTCDSNGCLSCQLGFYYDSGTPACSRCLSECSECKTSSTCLSCIPGYYFETSNNTCIQCYLGCDTCNSTHCLSCITGYALLTNGTCAFCYDSIPYCVSCDSSSCFECIYGFVPTSSNTTCSSCSTINGCQHCSSLTYCQVCTAGFYEDGLGHCLACSQGCTNCASNTNCISCLPTYLLQTTSCTVCISLIQGCQYCSAVNVCQNCVSGYYKSGSSCNLCRNSIQGCVYCNSSLVCTLCNDGFYLQTSNNTCQLCIGGCQHCNSSSICTQCQSGYYLQSNQCYQCSNIGDGCASCVTSSCLDCKARYFLSLGSCSLCSSTMVSCILCSSSSTCLQCQAGRYLNTSNQCSPCPLQGCQVCNDTTPTKCISCNSQYYLTGLFACQLCSIPLPNCIQCSSNSACLQCQSGFYVLPNNTCGICSQAATLQGCQMCSSSTNCLQCKSGYFLNSNFNCSKCNDLIPGCGYCKSSSVCSACLNGYFYNGAGGCSPCSQIQGCLICTNSTACSFCDQQYYLNQTAETCHICNATMTGCRSCISSTQCVLCTGQYQLSGLSCVQIKGKFAQQISQLKFSTYYVDADTLTHYLDARNGQFQYSQQNWQTAVQLTLIDQSDNEITLTIKSVQWQRDFSRIKFTTNNPLNISSSSISMPFVKRVLLQGSLPNNFKVKMVMNENTIKNIMPNLSRTSDLILDYDLSDPQFYNSYLQSNNNYMYYLIGITFTIILLLAYSIKSLASASQSDDKGQIIPHIFSIKIASLILYPTAGQYINYCYGFMTADFPWLNSLIGNSISEPSDFSYSAYTIYYINMNFASTYLFAFIIMIAIWICTLLSALGCPQFKRQISSLQSFIYLFFIFGLVVASCASIQGAFLNNISLPTMNSVFYILGICVYIGIFLQIMYSMYVNPGLTKFYKFRIFIKATLLSLAHLAPIAISVVAVSLDTLLAIIQCFIMFEIKPHPKTWLIVHIILNVALIVILFNPEMLITFIISTLLIIVALIVDSYIHVKQFIEEHKIMQVKISQNQQKLKDTNISIENIDQQPDIHKITHYDFRDKEVPDFQITQKTVISRPRRHKPKKQNNQSSNNSESKLQEKIHPYAMFLNKKV